MEEASTSQWLRWAALTHEIGLVIAHSQYHKHGGTCSNTLTYPDLRNVTSGFSPSWYVTIDENFANQYLKTCPLTRLITQSTW